MDNKILSIWIDHIKGLAEKIEGCDHFKMYVYIYHLNQLYILNNINIISLSTINNRLKWVRFIEKEYKRVVKNHQSQEERAYIKKMKADTRAIIKGVLG